MSARSKPQLRQTKPNEVVVSASVEVALECADEALEKLGTVKRRDTHLQVIEGRIKYGFQSVKIRVSLVERAQGETAIVIKASSDDIWGVGAKNATNRLVKMLLNLDTPAYRPDRLGIHPAALVFGLLGFVILIFLAVKYVMPIVLR